jgi:putative methionine-R-sulfoxide reductase with GAF domain
VDASLLAVAANHAAAAAAEATEPAQAIDAAVGAIHEAITGLLPSVFVFEHGRLWLVAHRGYAFVPDGLSVERGIMGRAVRLGRPQLAPDVRADPDFVATLPGILTELAIPLRLGPHVFGALNIESERALPDGAVRRLQPLASVLASLAEELQGAGCSTSLRSRDSSSISAASEIPTRLPLRSGEPRAVSFLHGDVDPAEAFILRELGMNALLLLPLHVEGRPGAW